MTSLRARQHDVHTTQISFWGQLKGASLGAVALLSMVQAMTECTFHDQVKAFSDNIIAIVCVALLVGGCSYSCAARAPSLCPGGCFR